MAPVAPGTAGALVGVALFVWIGSFGGVAFAVLTVVATALGFWASGEAGRRLGVVDDGRIVIDEVAGQLVALAPLYAIAPPIGWASSNSGLASQQREFWIAVVTGFVLFRCFDIAKPGPVAWAERRIAGGAGVMADDLVAGVLAALLLAAFALAAQTSGWVGAGGAA